MKNSSNPKRYDSHTVKKLFIDFFKSKQHEIIDNAPLIPQNDPSALFTTAGMHPLVPYLMGEPHPSGSTKLANIQKCLRTTDVELVGKSRRHMTVFEMAGNWSLNDYFKKDSLEWSFEFLTGENWLNLDPKRLYATVFAGLDNIPLDSDSIEIWKNIYSKLGIEADVDENPENSDHIARVTCYSDNWWGPVAPTGPCGPDSEIFYDTGSEHNPEFGEHCHPNCDCGRFVEVWNNVFMEFMKNEKGEFKQAAMKNVDTGLGLIRTTLVADLRNEDGTLDPALTIFSTDVFEKQAAILYKFIYEKELNMPLDLKMNEMDMPQDLRVAFKMSLEHIRATTFLGGENLEPSNKDQGYVLRRLLRRMIRGLMILIDAEAPKKDNQLIDIMQLMAASVMDQYKEEYPHLKANKEIILNNIASEVKKFKTTLRAGSKIVEKTDPKEMNGEFAFNLYQSYGFPFELTKEIAEEKGVTISEEDYLSEVKKHQEISKKGMDKHFKGGLGDTSEMSLKYHTTTHLLHKALRTVLGDDVHQQGSNITEERLRFDINLNRKMTKEELKQVNALVNTWIKEGHAVTRREMTPEEADNLGALAFFKEKYGKIVSVYTIGDEADPISIERCGGPHVENIKDLGTFKIKKQEKIGANALRIKAILS